MRNLLSNVRWKVVTFWSVLFYIWYTAGWWQEKIMEVIK